ncbi:phage tail protein [Solihabitans fulvus]|uniref:Phage tail protein n=1 Tax=Solihabitans fulvus TaxID=1892852 RepID=A0A5B2X4P7_9PSEU|nr:phage tail protein [Solihabitans fulvus]KAA2258091.1 phage tail protein [Solihabitans fulvus]
MTRAAIPDLPSRHPLGGQLPALYAADGFAQRFTSGLDVVLAPIVSTVDNIARYLDPRLTPPDFLAWLACWVAADLDADWPQEMRRTAVAGAVAAHRWRGTGRGLVERLRLCADVHARVLDGPGATWSTAPGGDLPGEPTREVVVEVWPAGPGEVDRERVTALVASACPIHLTCVVRVLAGPPDQDGE